MIPAKLLKLLIIGCFIMLIFIDAESALDVITIKEGAISVISPDGTIISVKKGDEIPKLLPGSVIDLLTGSIEVAPYDNPVRVTAVDSTALIKPGNKITVSIYPGFQLVGFSSINGNMEIITGNIKTSLLTGEEVRLGLDKYTGVANIQSIAGNNVSFISGTRIYILQNSIAQIKLDPLTAKIKVTSNAGTVDVSSIEGERFILNHSESVDVKTNKLLLADLVGAKTVEEVAAEDLKTIEQTVMPGITTADSNEITPGDTKTDYDISIVLRLPTESPSEPEAVEASPYMP